MDPAFLIYEGDTVLLVFSKGRVNYKGIVKHIPAGPGDMWFIETSQGIEAINPYCSILVKIVKIKEGE